MEINAGLQIISHRGWWKADNEKNGEAAFHRSFAAGFGTETDIRDHDGKIVISHDMPSGNEMTLEAFLSIFSSYDVSLPLALNIKSDGLCGALCETLVGAHVPNAFVFDMSVPDMLHYRRNKVPYFTRMSDIEPVPALVDQASGIWVDEMESPWQSAEILARQLDAGVSLCLVSPELHGRDHMPVWDTWQGWIADGLPTRGLMICTDFPSEAKIAFGGL